ncbi:MAG: prepilin-type N-terminal cleavage/methylation domain-containing protein, partial [Gammaproteobacteria bacterium]|nr:prepilin-type N-terminal cleavage/methylation domain-containing protein [Gammaproteobacteria bacterium]NIR92373.1 prepilin-type N-terminal cleavage/methylation domain-containing protein [Gammaproteobacteria bacterium]
VIMFFKGKDRGFTLVEVMVSLVIFLVASMGLLPLLLTNMQAGQANSLHSRARYLASEVMADLQIMDYASLEAVSGMELAANDFAIL